MGISKEIRSDFKAVFERDPATRAGLEVILTYCEFHAIFFHRLAYWLWAKRLKLIASFLSHISRFVTGIEIHPGARIGKCFFNDHGMGVVIGETSEIGENVTIYHGVTLGGTSFTRGKRHPTIESNVTMGAGAKILGPLTVGKNSKIGANSIVIKNVSPNSSVIGIPGKIIPKEESPVYQGLDHHKLPDPEERVLQSLIEHIKKLEKRTQVLESKLKKTKEEKRVLKVVKTK